MLTRILPRLYGALGAGRWLRYRPVERLYLALFFAYKRFAEDPFAALCEKRRDLFSGGHVLDVGANVGYTAVVFANVVDEPYAVHAFEPEPVNFATMQRVIRRRGLSGRVVPVQLAAGDRSGHADLAINPAHPGDHHVVARETGALTITVPIVTLDEFVESRGLSPVKFVKIDVQGLELAVSRGMGRLLEASPAIAVAFEYTEASAREYGYTRDELFGFYSSRGFRLHLLTQRGELLEPTPDAISDAQARRGYVDVLATRTP